MTYFCLKTERRVAETQVPEELRQIQEELLSHNKNAAHAHHATAGFFLSRTNSFPPRESGHRSGAAACGLWPVAGASAQTAARARARASRSEENVVLFFAASASPPVVSRPALRPGEERDGSVITFDCESARR